MPQCEKITVHISQASPVWTLYQKMKEQFNVTDEVFDKHGHYEVNYKEPGKSPTLKGVEDCYVGPADVLDLSYDNWKKHRKVIEESLGKQMSWPLTDENSAYPFSPEMKALSEKVTGAAKQAIGKLDEILAGQGLDKGSVEYQRQTALCVYYFAKFPTAQIWSGLDDDKKKEWLQKISGLATIGLEQFQEYLLTNGGLGLWFNSKFIPTMYATTGLESLMWSGGFGHSYLLYGLYDLAGLKPQFVETEPTLQKGETANTVALGFELDKVGVKIGDEFFFPGGEELKKGRFYPMALRHLLYGDLYRSIKQKNIVSGKQVEMFDVMGQLKRSLDYGDDLTSASCSLRPPLASALFSSGEKKAAMSVMDADRFMEAGSDFCLMSGGMAFASSKGETESGGVTFASSLKDIALAEHLLKKLAESENKDSRLAGLLFLAIFKTENEDNKAALKYTESALEIEPDSPQALCLAGLILSKSKGKDLQRGEEVLDRVITLSPKTSKAYYLLAYIHARQGKYETAASDLRNEIKLQQGEPLKSFYLLGWSLWNAGKKDDAKAAWGKMAHLYERPIRIIQAGKDKAKSQFDDFKKMIDEFALTPEMLADQDAADNFGWFLSRTGDGLLYHDEPALAKEAFLKALEFKPSSEVESAIRWKLALIYQQLGETDKALIEVGRSIERR